MRIAKHLVAALIGMSPLASPAPALAEEIDAQRFGLYVLADDVERSVAFYEALFERPPQVRTPAIVGFNVGGGLFAVVSRRAYAPDEPRAGSVRPYIRVADIESAFAHVARIAPGRIEGGHIVREGPFAFFRFTDLDGNVIELFALSAQPAANRK